MKIFLKTILDMGFKRIKKRVFFELRKIIEKKIPSNILLTLTRCPKKVPPFSTRFKYFESRLKFPSKHLSSPKYIDFIFLNERKSLSFPLEWNSKTRKKLWQFNLHYFDWIRDWINQFFISGNWPDDSKFIEYIIDDWIDNNPIGKGDGWSSYTISLRCRNLIYLYRIFPKLLNEKRLKSLWEQIFWLKSHIEDCYGGNHLLENLITLCIACLQFESSNSFKIYEYSINLLESELKEQILNDGGHFERSTSYHLLMLDRLCELGFILQGGLNIRPKWLEENIRKMVDWVKNVRLHNGNYPQFNDSASDSLNNLDKILQFANSYLNQEIYKDKSFRNYFSKVTFGKKIKINYPIKKNETKLKKYQIEFVDLPQTGWLLVRTGNGYELTFKCGIPCPNYLPAHVHSDLLSFNLYKFGDPILVEAGTSNYENNSDRYFERSGKAHNVFQLSKPKLINQKGNIHWIESVDVWNKFRAGRKAKILKRTIKRMPNGSLIIRGSHDANRISGSYHERSIFLKMNEDNSLNLSLKDYVYCVRNIHWRQLWHLAPTLDEENFLKNFENIRVNSQFHIKEENTWYSKEFGKKQNRSSYCISGTFESGINEIGINLNFST